SFRARPGGDAIAAGRDDDGPPPLDPTGDELVRQRATARDDAIRPPREGHRALRHERKRHNLRSPRAETREVWRRERRGDRVDQHEPRANVPETSRVAPVTKHDGRHTNAGTPQSREHVLVVEIPPGAPLRIP